MARPAQPLAGFLEPRDPGRAGPGVRRACGETGRKRETEMEGVMGAAGREGQQGGRRARAGWGAQAQRERPRGRRPDGEQRVETVAEADTGGRGRGGADRVCVRVKGWTRREAERWIEREVDTEKQR